MARSSRSSLVVALTAVIVFAAGVSISGHRRDEFLQAARIAIEPDRVRIELDLTPGIAVADAVLSDIDRDRDGSISAAEQTAYVARVTAALSVVVDSTRLVPRVTAATFPSIGAIRNGEGIIQIQLTSPLDGIRAGAHRLDFRNSNRPDIGVYLANALVPASDRVAVTDQRRDYNQRTLDVDYRLDEDRQSGWWRAGLGAAGVFALLGFIVQRKGTL